MNTIEQEMKRLDNIANMYNKTGGEMREMWKQKWYKLVKNVARRHNEMYPKIKEDRLNK
mgnify:CR=1 FL=1|jgi:hypothetical protein|tara:strand:- start:1057 stop:1233 length:177 start_codon:yes stop_codon:yes gene_type:complete